jgi:hypothetical protein
LRFVERPLGFTAWGMELDRPYRLPYSSISNNQSQRAHMLPARQNQSDHPLDTRVLKV